MDESKPPLTRQDSLPGGTVPMEDYYMPEDRDDEDAESKKVVGRARID